MISGKILNAILQVLVFVFINSLKDLNTAIMVSLGVAVIFAVGRMICKQNWKYAFGGLVRVVIASALAWPTEPKMQPIIFLAPW